MHHRFIEATKPHLRPQDSDKVQQPPDTTALRPIHSKSHTRPSRGVGVCPSSWDNFYHIYNLKLYTPFFCLKFRNLPFCRALD